MNIEIIVGLPASGKTHYANTLLETESFGSYLLFDDIKPKEMNSFRESLRDRQDIILIDPYLCFPRNRVVCENYIREYHPDLISWHYFANDKEQCLINAKSRDKQVTGFIELASVHYTIPQGYKHLPVFKREN